MNVEPNTIEDLDAPKRPDYLRTLLILGRVSNLPTVWSNCLAGWLLGGGGNWLDFLWLCVGTSFLYIGGMFLNDAFDAKFDREFRKERPISSGKISEPEVWGLGFTWLAMGATFLVWMGTGAFIFTVLLVACILFYDWVHKKTILSPLPMAGCRFLLYLLAASTATNGVNGLVIWSALVLAAYIVGLSYIAKTESAPGPLRFWPLIFLAAPLVLAWLVNEQGNIRLSFGLSAILALWTLWNLRHIFAAKTKNIGAAVSGLLAGIVLVDLLAVLGGSPKIQIIFIGLFLATRLFQKVIPAT